MLSRLRHKASIRPFSLFRFFLLSLLWHLSGFAFFFLVFRLAPAPGLFSSQSVQETQITFHSLPPDRAGVFLPPEDAPASRRGEPDNDPAPPPVRFHSNEEIAPRLSMFISPKPLNRVLPASRSFVIDRDRPAMAPTRFRPETGKTKSRPFRFSPNIQARRLLFMPDLPEYPAWAEEMGLEIRVVVELQVEPSGEVTKVAVLQSSGSLDTDHQIESFVRKLRFDSSPNSSSGRMTWDFFLE